MTLNRLSGLVVAVTGGILLAWIIPRHTESVSFGWLQPATLPNITAVIILAAGLIQLIFPAGRVDFDGAFSLRVALFFTIGTLGLVLMGFLGFIIAAPVLALVLMLIIGERRPPWMVGGILLLPAGIWFCVAYLLDRPLP